MSIHLKACLRCHGDLFIEYDFDSGQGWSCLQCGWKCEKDKVLGNCEVLLGEDGNMLRLEWKIARLHGEPIEM